ncbi:MAG TPA: aminotransferase class III-fold pyridoxal phosphate-dependent enzyme [Terriglobales bacterium]|nr:aminotransferase class III-fold pyridoxal phosphate-dependent enzyme [Terriglobales bacterium]
MITAIIQARMGSQRFPGKSMADICGRPMLGRVCDRVRTSQLLDQLVVATSTNRSDDAIANFCNGEHIQCFRGGETDVLDRFYHAAREYDATTIARITADCPLIDGEIIDRILRRFLQGDCDYVSNTLRYTYPDGLDVEVFSFAALDQAWKYAEKPSEREHVTPYLRAGNFRTANVESSVKVPVEVSRWTVDHPGDLEFVREIFAALGDTNFHFEQVLDLMRKQPAMAAMTNAEISNDGYYRSLYREAKSDAAGKRFVSQSEAWLKRSLKVIPGGAQTFSKGYTQYVQGVAPVFLQRGKGCRVWDVDGNEYIDYVQGLLPNILGYAHDEVNHAVAAHIFEGNSFSLPHPIEVELAERLTRLIPCAEMVRFGKNGSDVTSGAIRAARALTGRERIACCGYHGWQDWYIGSTTRNAGVPASVRDLTHKFTYNDLNSLEGLFREYPGQFAAVILEPFNFTEPGPGFLQAVKDLTHQHGALLIFDEICSGFHFGLGGAQKLFGVIPDMACFGKAMANGFPISCVVGRAEMMKIFQEIFFSFTFAGETSSIAAAMKVLDILETTDALARIEANGRILQDGLNSMSREAAMNDRIKCVGRPQWSLLKFTDSDGKDDPVLKNLFQQEAMKRDVLLLSTHNMTAAHDHAAIQQTLEVYAEVLRTIGGWLNDTSPARFLEGSMSQPVFRVR